MDCLILQDTLWWTNILQWKDPPILNGKIHYFYGHFQLLFVSSPEGMFTMIWVCLKIGYIPNEIAI